MNFKRFQSFWLLPLLVSLALLIVSLYNLSQTLILRLPLTASTTALSIILPGINLLASSYLTFSATADVSGIPFTVFFYISSLLDTALVTLSAHQLSSSVLSCTLDVTWRAWFQAKNVGAIRNIQDALQCCGFRSTRDKAWPFPGGDVGVHACEQMVRGSVGPCSPAWQERTEGALVVCIVIAAVGLGVKVGIALLRVPGSGWRFRMGRVGAVRARGTEGRRLIGERETNDAETAEGHEHYTDEEQATAA